MAAATKTTTLLSLAALKAALGIASSDAAKDAQLAADADGVSEAIDGIAGRPFVKRSVTETRSGRNKPWFLLNAYPVASVTTLKFRWSSWSELVLIPATDYLVDLEIGKIHLRGSTPTNSYFPDGPMAVEAVYVAGFDVQDGPALPAEIVRAMVDWVKFVWDRRAAGLVVAVAGNFGGTSIRSAGAPPKDVIDAVLSYRKVRL